MTEDKMFEQIERITQRGKDNIPNRPEAPFSPVEKAEQLFGLFSEYSRYKKPLYRQKLIEASGGEVTGRLSSEEAEQRRLKRRKNKVRIEEEVAHDPLVQKLEGQISRLWHDPQVRVLFLERIREALRERKHHEKSLSLYQTYKHKSAGLEDEYQDLMRNHFLLRQMTPTLRGMEIARNKMERDQVKAEISELEEPPKTNKGLLSREKADLASLVAFERLEGYHKQFTEDGFIRTPSRQKLLEQILTQTAQGTWILLTGETGSGKTKLATVVSRILNGEAPLYASGEERGDVSRLIGTKAMTALGQSYYELGPLTAGMTGFTNSLEIEHGGQPQGKIVVIDEVNKFNQDALFGAVKVAHNIRRPGETFNYKELPGVTLRKADKGFGLIATRNPATVRYERQDLDPALERLFYDGKITIDYPPMSSLDPELYEIFLSMLMDHNGRIRIAKTELAPAYQEVTNKAEATVTQNLDPDVKKHGALYRFALAVGEIHKSFNQQPSIARAGTDEGFLERTVLEMGVLVDWMSSYSAEVEGGLSLTDYLDKKLHDFYSNIDNQTDKAIFNRVFGHFGFDISHKPQPGPKPGYEILTPLEMGYLTPRTERAVRKFGDEAAPQTKLKVLSDGTPVYYLPVSHVIDQDRSLASETMVEFDGKQLLYLGTHPDTGESTFIPLNRLSREEIDLLNSGKLSGSHERRANTDSRIERAKQLFGEDFLGEEAIRALEEKCKAAGIDVSFEIPTIQFPYSEQDLIEAKRDKNKGKERMLTLRPSEMLVNGQKQPVTLITLRDLFAGKNPFGTGPLFYPDTWYNDQTFAKATQSSEYALPTKEVVPDSTNKTWQDQNSLIESGEKRREAIEAVWDTLLYYANTGKKNLESNWDWTKTQTSDGHLVRVGWRPGGLHAGRWAPSYSYGNLGAVLSR